MDKLLVRWLPRFHDTFAARCVMAPTPCLQALELLARDHRDRQRHFLQRLEAVARAHRDLAERGVLGVSVATLATVALSAGDAAWVAASSCFCASSAAVRSVDLRLDLGGRAAVGRMSQRRDQQREGDRGRDGSDGKILCMFYYQFSLLEAKLGIAARFPGSVDRIACVIRCR
jgi:hypothetical protein